LFSIEIPLRFGPESEQQRREDKTGKVFFLRPFILIQDLVPNAREWSLYRGQGVFDPNVTLAVSREPSVKVSFPENVMWPLRLPERELWSNIQTYF
jgi:hypothetical protein